jgi:hypothetical protein
MVIQKRLPPASSTKGDRKLLLLGVMMLRLIIIILFLLINRATGGNDDIAYFRDSIIYSWRNIQYSRARLRENDDIWRVLQIAPSPWLADRKKRMLVYPLKYSLGTAEGKMDYMLLFFSEEYKLRREHSSLLKNPQWVEESYGIHDPNREEFLNFSEGKVFFAVVLPAKFSVQPVVTLLMGKNVYLMGKSGDFFVISLDPKYLQSKANYFFEFNQNGKRFLTTAYCYEERTAFPGMDTHIPEFSDVINKWKQIPEKLNSLAEEPSLWDILNTFGAPYKVNASKHQLLYPNYRQESGFFKGEITFVFDDNNKLESILK